MAKTDSKPTSFRFKDEAKWALEDLASQWRCSQIAVLEKLVLAAHAGADVTTGEAVPRYTVSSSIRNPADLQAMINEKQGHESSASGPMKRYRCEHCGRPLAVMRVGEICGGCQETEHRGDTRDCRECGLNRGGI